jgi:hypothetical protein
MNTCGNEFVYAHDQGARLMITYRFDFASVNEKHKFASLFGRAGPRVITKSEFNEFSNSYHKKTKLTISAYQIGGVPFYLNQIFNNSGKHKNKISCTFDDISACLELMSNLFDYENDLKPEHFWGQIVNFKNYSTLKLYTNPWEYLGIDVQSASNNSVYNDQDEYLKILFKLFDNQFKNWLDSDRMITAKIPELIAQKRQRMEKLKSVFYKNINTIKAAIETCYDLPDFCKSKTENIDSYLIPASSKDILELLAHESKSSNQLSR